MPPGLTSWNTCKRLKYVRVHGARGYRGRLDRKDMSALRKCAQPATKKQRSIVIFNNTFLDKENKSCYVEGVGKISLAAPCDAIEFADA